MAFVGAINAEVRKWLGNIARTFFTGRRMLIGCSGNFTVEQIVSRNANPAWIHGNDVSLYSSAIGAYLSGQDFRLEIGDDRISFLAPYLNNPEDKAAAVLIMSEALNNVNEKNPYQVRLWRHYVEHYGKYHAKTVERLRNRKAGIRLDRFTSRDIGEVLEEASRDTLVIAFLPTYAGGYEKLFKRMEELFDWDRPQYRLIDAGAKERLIRAIAGFDYVYIDDTPREDLPQVARVQKRGLKTVYLYSNLPLEDKAFIQSRIGSKVRHFERLKREDLNIIEEAMGYKGVLDMGMTLEEGAGKMGFKQVWRVQERLNLLKLDPLYRDCLVKGLITPSQAQELSRLPMDGQRILFEKIKNGQANTYNKLRSLANAILFKCDNQEQATFIVEPTDDELEIKSPYDRIIEGLVNMISRSFSEKDLRVLKTVMDSNIETNIERLDLIIGNLNKIKRSMIEARGLQEVMAA
ncbi:MAG: hypothetical protein JXL84_26165 [Deltaproteobacteria bacterium]|nr:hypothetical protein [Deltaproteobacteria bacterium]